MKTEKFDGEIASYQGKNLSKPISYSGTVEVFTNKDEAVAATKWPGDNEVLEFINSKLVTSAKAKAYQDAASDLKKAYEASPEYKRKMLVNAAVEAGFSQAEAEALAESKLGK